MKKKRQTHFATESQGKEYETTIINNQIDDEVRWLCEFSVEHAIKHGCIWEDGNLSVKLKTGGIHPVSFKNPYIPLKKYLPSREIVLSSFNDELQGYLKHRNFSSDKGQIFLIDKALDSVKRIASYEAHIGTDKPIKENSKPSYETVGMFWKDDERGYFLHDDIKTQNMFDKICKPPKGAIRYKLSKNLKKVSARKNTVVVCPSGYTFRTWLYKGSAKTLCR
ncbi:MAG: hypothetical protein V1913_06590, partial [Fibrobacterota bacterium]